MKPKLLVRFTTSWRGVYYGRVEYIRVGSIDYLPSLGEMRIGFIPYSYFMIGRDSE